MIITKRMCCNYLRIQSIVKMKKPGDTLGVKGWIQNIRRMKNNIFFDIKDGSTSRKFQIVVPKNEEKNIGLTIGSSIRAIGRVAISPNGDYELHAEDVNVIANGNISDGYPFTPKQNHSPEYVREHLHLRSRVDYVAAQIRLRHKVFKAIHDIMDQRNFVLVNTPVITTNDCEGAGEIFVVKPDSDSLLKEMKHPGIPLEESYFDGRVYLSVSGQLHLEAMAYGLGNVYTIAPAFRAENSRSPLHLSEFYMLEAELSFIDDLEEITTIIEDVLKNITQIILNNCLEELSTCRKKISESTPALEEWVDKKWKLLSYNEARDIILANRDKLKFPIRPGEGLSKEQELFLTKYCKAPVFVVEWPLDLKPFYMRVSRQNPSHVHAVDLLMPTIGELCGGGLRECNPSMLQRHPKFPKNLEWYLELRKFGGVPTGGFGIGIERYLQLLTGVKNIRDVIPFPRYPHSCKM